MDYRGVIEKAFTRLFGEISKVRFDAKMRSAIGKGASGDTTHAIDALAEKLLIDSFRREIPGCTIISEEVGIVMGESNAPIVLMDPIDGSANAIRGLPVFCASVGILDGLLYSNMKTAGVIDLVSGERITGDVEGVFLNRKKQKPSDIEKISEAMVTFELKVRVERPMEVMDKMYRLLDRTKHPRVLGSAALEIAYVAIGRMDAYVAPGKQLRNYDCLPSIFLVKSAGGFVQGIGQDLDSIDVMSKERVSFIVAGHKKLGQSIADAFSNVRV